MSPKVLQIMQDALRAVVGDRGPPSPPTGAAPVHRPKPPRAAPTLGLQPA